VKDIYKSKELWRGPESIYRKEGVLALSGDKTKAIIINQTSVGSITVLPFQSVYTASKGAIAMFSNSIWLELDAFGITAVDLKTGVVRSNLIKN
jgi:short-subunit dehydrogenase